MNFNIIFLLVTAIFCSSFMETASSPQSCSVPECLNNKNGDLSTAILCNDCVKKIFSDPDATSLFNKVQQRINYNGPKRLSDLNADVLFIIFDQLDIMQIFQLIKAYPAEILSAVAKNVFFRRYKDYEMDIWDVNNRDSKGEFTGIDIHEEKIRIGYKMNYEILKYFGDAMRYVSFSTLSIVYIQNVNRFTCNSLSKLRVSDIRQNTLTNFKRPFKAVEEFIGQVQFSNVLKFNTGRLSFSEMFPKLRLLTLFLDGAVDLSFLNYEFAFLEDVNILRSGPFSSQDERNLGVIFKKNPQIRFFQFSRLTQTLCDVFNNATNLKNVTVGSYDLKMENQIILHHVKHFKISCFGDKLGLEAMSKLSLPQLETLDIPHSSVAGWKEFVEKQKHVTHLKISSIYTKSDVISPLLAEMPNVIETTLEIDNLEIVNKIIQSNQQLMKMNFARIHINDTARDVLKDRFENDWNIIFGVYTLILEKKA